MSEHAIESAWQVARPKSLLGEMGLIGSWAGPVLFQLLSPHAFVQLLSALLQERSVVFTSVIPAVASAAVLAVVPLLWPLRLSGLYFPVLAPQLLPFLDSPVPFVAGVMFEQLPACLDPGAPTKITHGVLPLKSRTRCSH